MISSLELSRSILLSIVVPRLSIFFDISNREKTNHILNKVSIMKEKKKLDENKFVFELSVNMEWNKYYSNIDFKLSMNLKAWWKKFLNLKFVMIAIVDECLSKFDILLKNIRSKLSVKQI